MTKQEQLDRMLQRRRHEQKMLETLTKEIGVLKTEIERVLKTEIERVLKTEIERDCAPNHAKDWSKFEHEHLQEKFNLFVFDCARHAGRTTSSIRHRIAEILIPIIGAGKMCGMAHEQEKRESVREKIRDRATGYRGPERRASVTGFGAQTDLDLGVNTVE